MTVYVLVAVNHAGYRVMDVFRSKAHAEAVRATMEPASGRLHVEPWDVVEPPEDERVTPGRGAR
jgi:hypothetical protein